MDFAILKTIIVCVAMMVEIVALEFKDGTKDAKTLEILW